MMQIFHARILACITILLWLTVGAVSLLPTAQAQTFKMLYKFTGGADGAQPYAGMLLDTAGNLYGTTYYGGSSGYGTAFELTPGSGGWQESVLHSFTGGADGSNPSATLTFDPAGNLYGTTSYGGEGTGCFGRSCGTVFELSPGWSETTLYEFQGGADGGNLVAGVVLDRYGNLYSASELGGKFGVGSVFELSQGTGGWKETLLHSFNSKDGINVIGAPIFDAAGNLYGTAVQGGAGRSGTVWELMHGSWKEKTLYSFSGADGSEPEASLIFNKAGHLYGTTYEGGKYGYGAVFMLTPQSRGKWEEAVLHSFTGGTDGERPSSTLAVDAHGSLYGTTPYGGDVSCNPPGGCGTVFKLTPDKGGRWKKTFVHVFAGSDGWYPFGDLAIDPAGNLYGTTVYGGLSCFNGTTTCGVVFEITP